MLEHLLYLRAAENFAELSDKSRQDADALERASAALDLAQKAYWRALDAE